MKNYVKLLEELENSYVPEVLDGYIEAALFSSTDPDTDEPLDQKYSEESVATETRWKMLADCKKFVEDAGSLLDGLEPRNIGIDFWFTRNHHGVGFWDRDNIEKEIGEKLTKISHSFGEICLMPYKGKLYQ